MRNRVLECDKYGNGGVERGVARRQGCRSLITAAINSAHPTGTVGHDQIREHKGSRVVIISRGGAVRRACVVCVRMPCMTILVFARFVTQFKCTYYFRSWTGIDDLFMNVKQSPAFVLNALGGAVPHIQLTQSENSNTFGERKTSDYVRL